MSFYCFYKFGLSCFFNQKYCCLQVVLFLTLPQFLNFQEPLRPCPIPLENERVKREGSGEGEGGGSGTERRREVL
uniref:Uncharacterized protein n=1 Tax=Lotus japonicus TaxID=34305 RepID=I3SKR9_LOTJA|nr:unknown [Lotus japonicus]